MSRDPWASFDPNAERNIDVPLFRKTGDVVEVVRGELPPLENLPAHDGLFGVIRNNLGQVAFPEVGLAYVEDLRISTCVFDPGELDWDNIDDIIDELERAIALLRRAKELGWTVQSSGGDGVFLEKPS